MVVVARDLPAHITRCGPGGAHAVLHETSAATGAPFGGALDTCSNVTMRTNDMMGKKAEKNDEIHVFWEKIRIFPMKKILVRFRFQG